MSKKYKIGYTTGVFDLFHIGHLNILKRAKEQCDYLIVGVSTDELALEYKKKMPVVPFSERCEIVAAVRFVDQVVPQMSRDKILAHEKYHFDVLFQGNDWRSGNSNFMQIEQELKSRGVDIIFFSCTPQTSSTLRKKYLEGIDE